MPEQFWPPEFGPYNPRLIAKRIENRRKDLGVTVKALTMDPLLGIKSRGQWSMKKDGKEAFTWPQISRLWLLLQGWTGFPFTSKKDGELLDAIKQRLAHSRGPSEPDDNE